MSVNRNVTVPVGRFGTASSFGPIIVSSAREEVL